MKATKDGRSVPPSPGIVKVDLGFQCKPVIILIGVTSGLACYKAY